MSECRNELVEENQVNNNQVNTNQLNTNQLNNTEIELKAVEQSAPVSLSQAVETSVLNYFKAVEGQEVTELYDILLQEVEGPLLTVLMQQVSYNQSRAAKILGLNRGTLRKKLKRYDLL